MMVAGVVKKMTAESAARAALGAGAIVMDTLAANDRRLPHEKIERIRQLRPDMILLAGGTDGGTRKHVIAMAELLRAAQPRPRLGHALRSAGDLRRQPRGRAPRSSAMLGDKVALQIVDNVRPTLERENLGPGARRDPRPVPRARDGAGARLREADELDRRADHADAGRDGPDHRGARRSATRCNVVGVDIGGATTDVFSVFDGVFNRTVSANLGMSYSVSNVLAEAGIANIQRWVPFDLEEHELRDRIGNKMIRPTTIPQTLDELKIEQAIAREALRLSFVQHKQFAVKLRGMQRERRLGDAFDAGRVEHARRHDEARPAGRLGRRAVACAAPQRSR